MGVGQLSESDAVDALRLPFYGSRHARGSHVPGNQFDLGNTSIGAWRYYACGHRYRLNQDG